MKAAKCNNVVKLYDRHDSFRSPKVVLEQALEHVVRIKQVTVIIEWDDGSYAVDHSPATVQQLMVVSRVGKYELGRLIDDGIHEVLTPTARQV